MDRRSLRLTVAAWTVVGAMISALCAIGFRAWVQTQGDARPLSDDALAQQLEALKAQSLELTCQSSVDTARDLSDWRRAAEACSTATASGKASSRAVLLLQRARQEVLCAQQLQTARRDTAAANFASVVTALELYEPGCRDTQEARRLLGQAQMAVQTTESFACLSAAEHSDWDRAYFACLRALAVNCWRSEDAGVIPPLGKKLSLWGKLSQNGWRPHDPVRLALLRAQDKLKVTRGWSCNTPTPPLFESDVHLAQAEATVRDRYRARFLDLGMAVAMERYHAGRLGDARRAFKQRSFGDALASPMREEADQLYRAVTALEMDWKLGLERINNGDVQGASIPFRRALALDELLMFDDAELRALSDTARQQRLDEDPTWLRVAVRDSMREKSLVLGQARLKLGDREGACKVWSVGQSFVRDRELDQAAAQNCVD